MDVERGKAMQKNNTNNNNGESDEMSTTTVDWRGRPSNPSKHGGMRAAAFVLGTCFYLFPSMNNFPIKFGYSY